MMTNRMLGMVVLLIGVVVVPAKSHAGGPTDWISISEVWSYKAGTVRILVTPGHNDPDGCGSTTAVHISTDTDKNVYSTVLTAFASGKQVSFYLAGCLTESGLSAAQVSRVAVK